MCLLLNLSNLLERYQGKREKVYFFSKKLAFPDDYVVAEDIEYQSMLTELTSQS